MSEHDKLVRRAGLWLRNTRGCGVVMTERKTIASTEIPDAIGWHSNRSIVVECKASRADFLADRKKAARTAGPNALGAWRFYLTPPGLIKEAEVPSGWGVYEVHDKQIRHAHGWKWSNAATPPWGPDRDAEVALLLGAIRRLEISATVFVRPDVEAPHE